MSKTVDPHGLTHPGDEWVPIDRPAGADLFTEWFRCAHCRMLKIVNGDTFVVSRNEALLRHVEFGVWPGMTDTLFAFLRRVLFGPPVCGRCGHLMSDHDDLGCFGVDGCWCGRSYDPEAVYQWKLAWIARKPWRKWTASFDDEDYDLDDIPLEES